MTVKSLPKPDHGAQRNWRMEKCSHYSEHSVSERFCAHCDSWVTAEGVIGGVWCPECKNYWRGPPKVD